MIEILLSVYNGEKYLQEQIDSILSQTYKDWNLLVRDDGSKDRSLDIIKEYVTKYPDKIRIHTDSFGNVGVKRSFELLLEASNSEYFMFCDQDDFWLPNKIELSYNQIKLDESSLGSDVPLLVHTDLSIVNQNLEDVGLSMYKTLKAYPKKIKSNKHIPFIAYLVTGCTILGNKKLKEVSLPFPEDIDLHDVWVFRKAILSNGNVSSLYDKTILYRQHQCNVRGASKSKQTLKDKLTINKQAFQIYNKYVPNSNIITFIYWKVNYFFYRLLNKEC